MPAPIPAVDPEPVRQDMTFQLRTLGDDGTSEILISIEGRVAESEAFAFGARVRRMHAAFNEGFNDGDA